MAAYKVTFRTTYGNERTNTVFADSAELAEKQVPAGCALVSVVETEDPTKFRRDLFRKEFLENVERLDDDSIAEYHAKVSGGEIVLESAPQAQQQATPVVLDVDVMRVLAEQYAAGQAQFTFHDTVKFPDEQYAHNIMELRYSKELGLYDQTWLKD